MSTGWDIVLYLHLVAMAFFLGGQLVIGLALVPVERKAPEPDRMRAVARRFGWGSVIALTVSLLTGAALASHLNQWSSTTLNIKMGLFLVLIALIFLHMKYPKLHALQGATLLVTLVVVWLGLQLGG